MRREESQRMSRIQHQGLLVRHLREILHGQTVLGPVLECGPIASVDDQLVGMLGYGHVQIVGDHEHDGCGLAALVGEIIYAPGVYLVIRTEPVHVDTSVGLKFFLEMVDRGVEGLGSRQLVRNTFNNRFLKISHIVKYFI